MHNNGINDGQKGDMQPITNCLPKLFLDRSIKKRHEKKKRVVNYCWDMFGVHKDYLSWISFFFFFGCLSVKTKG